MTAYRLAIDYGTSYSGAAIADLPAGEARTVFVNGGPTIPSLVVLDKRSGELLTGAAADNAAGIRPELAIRAPKRYLGRREPLFRDPLVQPEDAVAATLAVLATEAAALRDRQPPAEVVLTHPARWGAARRSALREAARQAGLGEVGLLPEPVAAALRFAAAETIEPGQFVAVYDLGAGTFDTAVLERTADGFVLHGQPGGMELGGDSFDERLYQHLTHQLEPADREAIQHSDELVWRQAHADFRRWIRLAKEALSGNPRGVDVRYPGPGDHEPLWLTRDELDEVLRRDLVQTVDELDRTIDAAGLTADRLAAIYLVGGSSKIPLVERLIVNHFSKSARLEDDRKQVVALGAAGAAAGAVDWGEVTAPGPAPAPEPEPEPPPPPPPPPESPRDSEPRPAPEPEPQPEPEPEPQLRQPLEPQPESAPAPEPEPDEGSPRVFLPPPGAPPRLLPRTSPKAAIAASGIAALAVGAIVLAQAGLTIGGGPGSTPSPVASSNVPVTSLTPKPTLRPSTRAPSPSPDERPQPTPTPTPGLPYAESFQDQASSAFEWDVGESDVYRQAYVNGSYLVDLDGDYYLDAEPLGLVAEETRVQANVTFVHGSGHAGVICRRSDSRPAFYYFAIGDKSSDGYTEYLVGQHDDDGFTGDGVSITQQDFGASPVVGLLCLGTSPVTLIGFINGEKMVSWVDSDDPLPQGGPGLVLRTFEDTEVLFDNFLAAEP